jgi:choline dehydrogenase-like flavoprotein
MLIEDPSLQQRTWDICLVGSGPVGMAFALELERLGGTVLLLESGTAANDAVLSGASHAEIVDEKRHAPMEIAVCRALGGTSWTWGGRSVPYDDIDWMKRDFVEEGSWPLSHDEIRPWYGRATEYLLCGSDEFEKPTGRPLRGGVTIDFVERWATDSRVILAHRERLLRSQKIHIALESTVTGLNLSSDGGHVESLQIATAQGPATVKARGFVLAMGGVETTRLLLAAQREFPRLFGGVHGPLGRYYMGHISGKIASILFNDPSAIKELDFHKDGTGCYYRRRFMLTAETQIKHQLLNTAFWPDNPPFYDPGHKSGVLSSVFLAIAFPPTGRKLLSEGIRLAHTGPRPYKLGAHVRNAILGAPAAVLDIYRILRDRFIRKPKKPGFLVSNRSGKYALHYHAEQIPHPDSRIELDSSTDQFGVPRARIDLRFFEQDVQSVIDSHRLLDEALQANGIGRLEYWYSGDKLRAKVYEQASDGFHQVGTTRMGDDAATSVVDSDLKVHGIDNLFVASSSVFPTSGQANSTLLAVAFGVRLAHHLHGPAASQSDEADAVATGASHT